MDETTKQMVEALATCSRAYSIIDVAKAISALPDGLRAEIEREAQRQTTVLERAA